MHSAIYRFELFIAVENCCIVFLAIFLADMIQIKRLAPVPGSP